MKKIIFILVMFLLIFSPSMRVNAHDITRTSIPKEYEDIENGPINEESGFANIVIFIKMADETLYTPPHDYNYYESMFNSDTEISLKGYYQEASYNQLTIESYIVNDGTTMIFYQDTYDRAYFEPYDEIENPLGYDGTSGNTQADREHGLLKRAIDYVEANDLVSESIDLDVNDDGDIDSITFMVSGEDDGWNSLFWPHKWSLSSYYNYSAGEYYPDAPVINGVYAYTYTFELLGDTIDYDNQVDVGVLVHETFHLISAPDLYHYYRYDYVEAVGDWGIMDNASSVPSHMLGYMKEMYGNWISNIDEITESGTYTLAPMSDSADNLYKLDLGYSNEYLYFEYRVATGLYESNLPGSGLLVYRIDLDYFDEGNVEGYYDEEGNPRDELFIFRPGIPNNPLPIVFPDFDDDLIDEDGDIDNAALSNNNLYDEMGNDTDIVMFYSDGTLMDIKIYNVLEHDGVITFDVYIPPRIELVSEIDIPLGTELLLLDSEGFGYRANIANVPDSVDIYYTLDGTTPDMTSTLYTGGVINFDASGNVITISAYDGATLLSTVSKEFTFTSDIQTNHDPYNNLQNITWYLDSIDDISSYRLDFRNDSETEEDYDFLYVSDSEAELSYSGIEMFGLQLTYDEDIIIQFISDESVNDFYGVAIDVVTLVDVQLNLIGDAEVTIEVEDDYTDLGAQLTGASAAEFTIETIGTVDPDTVGQYTITYNAIDEFLTVFRTVTRTVNVLDTTAPDVDLIGDSVVTIEVFSDYVDEGITLFDNYDNVLSVDDVNNVNEDIVGTYTVTFTVTDDYDNETIVVRTVHVVDTEDPTATLLPGIDTIYVGDTFVDASVDMADNYTTALDVETVSTLDNTTAGVYTIEYTVSDESGNEISLIRYVNVIERDIEIELYLFETLNTIEVNGEFTPAVCNYGGEFADTAVVCNVDISDIDLTTPGTYEVVYYVVIDEIRYERISYVFVIDNFDIIVWYYDKSRRGYL